MPSRNLEIKRNQETPTVNKSISLPLHSARLTSYALRVEDGIECDVRECRTRHHSQKHAIRDQAHAFAKPRIDRPFRECIETTIGNRIPTCDWTPYETLLYR